MAPQNLGGLAIPPILNLGGAAAGVSSRVAVGVASLTQSLGLPSSTISIPSIDLASVVANAVSNVPVASSGSAIALPGLLTNSSLSVAALTTSLPTIQPAVPAVPTTALPALPTINLPGLSNLPTGTALDVIFKTAVPLTQVSIISSLAALPENSAVPGLASVLSALDTLPSLPAAAVPEIPALPTSLPGSLPISALPTGLLNALPSNIPGSLPLSAPLSALPTNILNNLPAGLPLDLPLSNLPSILPTALALPTGFLESLPLDVPLVGGSGLPGLDVLDVLTGLGEKIVEQLAGTLSQILKIFEAAAQGGAIPELPVVPDGLVGGVTAGVGAAAEGSVSAGGGVKREAEAEAQVAGLDLGAAAATATALVNPIATATQAVANPLAGLTGALTGVTSGLGLGSILLNIVASLPIPNNLATIVSSLKTALVTPLQQVLTTTQLTQASNLLAILNLASILNVSQLGSLATLTTLPAVQQTVQLLTGPDLVKVVNILSDKSLVPSAGAGALLSNPLEFLKVVKAIVPVTDNPAAAVGFVMLQQLGIGGLAGAVASALPVGGGLPITT